VHDVRRVLPWAGLMLLLGVVGGLLWAWLAKPAEWEVTSQGIIRTEDEIRGQFGVIVRFVVIGAALCLIWGAVAGRVLRDLSWLLVPIFAAVASLAAVIAWRVGLLLGPPDPRTVSHPSIGDRLPSPLEIDAVAPFLVWPMFALGGLLLAVWLGRDEATADELSYDAS
jgi:hypothetical protein